MCVWDPALVRSVLGCTSGNAFPPTISVFHCVESICPRQFQYSQVSTDGLRPIFPWSSSAPFSPRSPVQHLFGFSICIVSVARNFLLGWVASPPRNPPPLSWLGTGADSACRFYMQNLWRSWYRVYPLKLKLDIKHKILMLNICSVNV